MTMVLVLESDVQLGLTPKEAAAAAVTDLVQKYKDTCRINVSLPI